MAVSTSKRCGRRCVKGRNSDEVPRFTLVQSASEIPESWLEATSPFSATYDARGEKTEPEDTYSG